MGKESGNTRVFLPFLLANDLCLPITYQKLQEKYKYTFTDANHQKPNRQIDHIAVRQTDRKSATYTGVYRSCKFFSDHLITICRLRIEPRKVPTRKQPTHKRYNHNFLKDDAVRTKFVNRFEEHMRSYTVNVVDGGLEESIESKLQRETTQFAEAVEIASKEVLGVRTKANKDWMTSELLDKIAERDAKQNEYNLNKTPELNTKTPD